MLFKKNLGNTAEPIKKNTKAITNVIIKLMGTEFNDSAKNEAKTINTINGLKIWYLKIILFFTNPKKFSPGYKLLKKLLTH